MKVLSGVVLLMAVVAVAVAAPSEIQEGFYLGRSGDVIIAGNSNLMEASIQTSFPMEAATMVDTQFAGAVLRQLGMPFVASGSTAESVPLSHDMFAPRRANLMVVVDGVTGRELNLRGVEISASKEIRSSSLPVASSTALLASMLTGATPRQHGIVADKWDYLGETEHAYIHAYPQQASLAEIVAQASSGHAQVIAASASQAFSRALGLRPSLNAYGTLAASLQYNVHSQRVEQVAGHLDSAVAHLDATELVAILRTHFRDETLLDTPEHLALYAELAMILKSVSELSLRAQAAASPDLYSFAITALNPIRTIHGTGASEYTSALALVRKTIVRAIEKVQHAYDDKAIYEVVCIRTTPRASEEVTAQIAHVAQVLDLSFDETARYFPHINTYLSNPCATLKAAGIQAHCIADSGERLYAQQNSAELRQAFQFKRAVIEDKDAEATVASWLMFMFTWIFLVIITFFIWWAFYNMDIGEDSVLYRMTNIPQIKIQN